MCVQGMHRFQCREAVVQALTAAGRYEGARDHAMRVGLCSRSGDILEPRLKPQWCDNLLNVFCLFVVC
jgi:valyl-tRNA synthetase